MPGRNYSKPFSIAGFILGEIYMLYTVLAPYRKGPPGAILYPLPVEPSTMAAGTPPPTEILAMKIAMSAIFFGPFGALVGLGVGLLIGGLLNQLWPDREPAPPPPQPPRPSAIPPGDSESPQR